MSHKRTLPTTTTTTTTSPSPSSPMVYHKSRPAKRQKSGQAKWTDTDWRCLWDYLRPHTTWDDRNIIPLQVLRQIHHQYFPKIKRVQTLREKINSLGFMMWYAWQPENQDAFAGGARSSRDYGKMLTNFIKKATSSLLDHSKTTFLWMRWMLFLPNVQLQTQDHYQIPQRLHRQHCFQLWKGVNKMTLRMRRIR